jgi:hypothetical protein
VPVNFATPIAHQTGSDYTAFNNALATGRPFRQILQTAPNPSDFVPGLELFTLSTGDVSKLFSWLDGILRWRSSSTTEPGDRLILETDPRTTGSRSGLSRLPMIESIPHSAIYENVDRAAVQAALENLLRNAHATASTNPKRPERWHPSMRMNVVSGGSTMPLKQHLDTHLPVNAEITRLVTDFVTGAAGAVVTKILVLAGDEIGRAAPFLAADPLPPSPPFNLGTATDPNRARRLTFIVRDISEGAINPIYYLHLFMNQMLLPTATRIVNSVTNIVSGGVLTHPLVSLYPSLSSATIPRAREQVLGQSKIPLGALASFHGFPAGAPISRLEWHHLDNSIFEVRPRVTGTPVPTMTPGANERNRVTNLWNTHGRAISTICESLQVPCELVISIVGTESPPGLDERTIRLEPLRDQDRRLLRPTVPPADELAYDKVIGIHGVVNAITPNANGTSQLDINLDANRTWSANTLSGRGWRLLIDDVDRARITGNTAGTNTRNYRITVRDPRLEGGFIAGGTQNPALTLYYSPVRRAAGNPTETAVRHNVARPGSIRSFNIQLARNTLDGPTVISVFHNGVSTALRVTLPPGARNGRDSNPAHAFNVAAGDNISIEVNTAGTTGNIQNVTCTLVHSASAGPTPSDVWVLEGYSTSVPNPWNGTAAVRTGRTLTWDQLSNIIVATLGARVSPGLIQTLISTAQLIIPWITKNIPNIYTTLGIPTPPANIAGLLNDWLLHGERSILVGAAFIRRQYNQKRTNFDLPLVGSAYNTGDVTRRPRSLWGLGYFGEYPERSGPHFNAAAGMFNAATPPPVIPSVRFMR